MPETCDLGQQGWETLYDKLKAHGKPPALAFWDLNTGLAVLVPACLERSQALLTLLPSTAASKALEEARVDG